MGHNTVALALVVWCCMSTVSAYDTWKPPFYLYRNFNAADKQQVTEGELIDVDGDRLPDFVWSWADDPEGQGFNEVYLSQGDGWKQASDVTEADRLKMRVHSPVPFSDVLTVVEAAALLRLDSTEPLMALIKKHVLPVHEFTGGEIRISKQALLSFMATRMAPDWQHTELDARVAHVLSDIHLTSLREVFVAHGVDWEVFLTLSEQDLKDMGIGAVGIRRRLSQAIAELL